MEVIISNFTAVKWENEGLQVDFNGKRRRKMWI